MPKQKERAITVRQWRAHYFVLMQLLSYFLNSLSNFLDNLLDSSLSGNDRVESSLESSSVLLGQLANESDDSS